MADVLVDHERPDTTDMLAVHGAFRDALAEAPELVGRVAAGDTARASVVAGYYANVLAFVEAHHEGEDALLWPRLVARSPSAAQIAQRLETQHVAVSEHLAHARLQLATWASSGQPAAGGELVAALQGLAGVLVPHCDDEEAAIIPLAAEHIAVDEWSELAGHAMQHFAGDNVWLCLGLVYDRMTPEQREDLLAHLPPPVAELWSSIGEPAYRDFLAELRR